jgi:serine/threonine-protein kinase
MKMVCKECGSEVAEHDAFCPFCGLQLPKAGDSATPEPSVPQDSFVSTILMTPSPKAAEAVEAVPPPVSLEAPTAESVEVTEPAGPDSDQAALAGTDEPRVRDLFEASSSDVPAPRLLGEISRTADNISPTSTSDFSLDAADAAIRGQAKPELPAGAEAEVPVRYDAPGIDGGDGAAAVEVAVPEVPPDQITTEEIDPKPFAAPVTTEAIAEDVVGPEVAHGQPPPSAVEIEKPFSAQAAELKAAEEETDVEPVPDRIARPMEGLEVPDSSPSIFDSVRIMENREISLPDHIDTRIGPLPSAQGVVERGEAEAQVTPPVGVESRPGTAPNMGEGQTSGRPTSKLKALTEGTVLNNRYEIIRKIGGGGMGAVYLASDNNLGGVLRAVKEMVQAHIEDEQQDKAINDFKRESMILSTLDHPAIPTIFDYFYDEKESRFYLVMKYISGGDLSARLRAAPEGRLDEKTVTEWSLQVVDVLDYLHNQPSPIVYRDLKPSNIMLDGNSGRLMLIDFGIARSIGQREQKGVTAVGTMGYAPPELFSGNVEPRSDIYSLGSTMFHLLTGADPQSNPLLIFDFQKNPRPRQINPQLSDQMERILMRAVEYSADSRFESAAEMRRVLEGHYDNLRSGNVTFGTSEAPKSISLANQMVFCGFCGQRIVATDLFCAFCGAKQPIAQQGVHSEIYSRGATAKLVIEGTAELTAPSLVLSKDENLVGRRDPMSNIFPEVDLSKYDPQTKISRRHARIWREGTNYMLEDLGSSNGTVLAPAINDSFRLQPHQPHVLSSGDKIKIGDTTLHFVVGQ